MRAFVKSYVLATTVNGRSYAKMQVINSSQNLTINVWGAPKKIYTGCVVAVNEAKLINNDKGTSINFTDLLFDSVDKYPDFKMYVEISATDDELLRLVTALSPILSDRNRTPIINTLKRLFKQYEKYPAARSNHHAFVGGLSRHTYELLNMFVAVYPSLPFRVNPDIVTLACVYHDYGKMFEYTKELELTNQFYLMGHPFISAREAVEQMIGWTSDTSLIEHVTHCILSHHGRKEWGAPVEPATPEAFLVHHLDMLSGHGYTYEHAAEGEKQFALNNLPVIRYTPNIVEKPADAEDFQ